MSKYSKEDEKLVKEFLDNLYSHHQSLKGGSLSGGSFFTEFLHGFLTPFKQFGHWIPGVGKVLGPIADAVDGLIPGQKYDTLQDIVNNKPSGKGRGRPRKVKHIPIQVPVKRKAGRPRGSKNKSKA